MTFEKWSWFFSIVAGVVALIGFPAVWLQLRVPRQQRRDAERLSTSQVLLAADGVLAAYADVAEKLRPGGEWEQDSKKRPTEDELGLVEPYLGIFERIFIAVDAAQIEDEVVDQLYGYRLANIWKNERLVEVKLQHPTRRQEWKRLIALTYVVEAHRGRRLHGHTDTYFPSDLFDRRPAEYVQRLKRTS